MLFIDTSVFVSRSTPLIVADLDSPFIEASPKRLLRPDQQLSYKRHMLESFSEQQDLAKKGLVAPVIFEEDILSLISLELGEKLEVVNVQVPSVLEAPALAQQDNNPFRALAEKENGRVQALAAPKSSKSPFLLINGKDHVVAKARNPFRKVADGKENIDNAQSKVSALDRARNPFKVVQKNDQVLLPRKHNPFYNLDKKDLLQIPLSTPIAPEPSKLSLASFDFLERLGQGGQGSVYLVRPKGGDIHAQYALKIIPKDGINSDDQTVLFEKEILQLNRGSGCLAELVGAFHDFVAFYFVMPFCPGGDLDAFLWDQPGHRFPLDVVQFYAAEIVWGMLALHRAKLLHRDLKLLNVFIKADGHVCIGDFGLAVRFEADHTPVQEGYWCGTPSHVAPEIWQGKGWTTASDWWAVGVMVYQMLHGKMPWNPASTDNEAMSAAVCRTEPVYSRGLDPAAQRLLEGLLRKSRNARFGFYQVAMDPFFNPTPWTLVSTGSLSPPFLPMVQDDATTVPLEHTPKDAAPYSFLDPYPHFGFISPELEEAVARVISTAIPSSCEPTSTRRPSSVVVDAQQVRVDPIPSTSKDALGLSYMTEMKNFDKTTCGSGSSSSGETLVDNNLADIKDPECQALPIVEVDDDLQVPTQIANLVSKIRWEHIRYGWAKFQNRVQGVLQKGSGRC